MDVPGTTSGGIDTFLLSFPTEMAKSGPFLGQNMLAFIYVENRKPGPLLEQWNEASTRKKVVDRNN